MNRLADLNVRLTAAVRDSAAARVHRAYDAGAIGLARAVALLAEQGLGEADALALLRVYGANAAAGAPDPRRVP